MADANVFVAAFLRDSTVRRIILLPALQLFVPEYLFEELRPHVEPLARRARMSRRQARELIERLKGYFVVVPREAVERELGRPPAYGGDRPEGRALHRNGPRGAVRRDMVR